MTNRHQRRNVIAALLLILGLILGRMAHTAGPVAVAQTPPDFAALIETDTVMQHIEMLAGTIGARLMGSAQETQAAAYIADQLAAWGYTVEIQAFETDPPFPTTNASETVTSRNVIATRPGTTDPAHMIVIGAHMDSVDDGTGAGDNASGVAVMLAAAEALAGWDTPHTLVFIAFGAEESGSPSGAETYVASLGENITHVIAMINIDSVGMGTDLNVYAGAVIDGHSSDGPNAFTGGPIWVRDLALATADALGIPMTTTPPQSWDGFTGAWSDHYAFVEAGVPIAYFEAWDWSDTENAWWGRETPDGDYLHTERDVVANVVPDKVEHVAEVVAATVYEIGFSAEIAGRPTPNPLPIRDGLSRLELDQPMERGNHGALD